MLQTVFHWIAVHPWALLRPALYLSLSILAGFTAEKAVIPFLAGRWKKHSWMHLAIPIQSLRGILFYASIFAGLHLAIVHIAALKPWHGLSEQILTVILVYYGCRYASRLLSDTVDYHSSAVEGVLPSPSILVNVGNVLIVIAGVLIALQSLHISITPILTALGVGGLAVALAMQDTLSNLFSGLYIIASKQIATGDYVRLDAGQEGYVADITWRNTTIRTLSGNICIVPNNKIATMIVTNYHRPIKELSFSVQGKLAADADLEKAELIAVEVATAILSSVVGGIVDPPPTLRFEALNDGAIVFSVGLRVREFADQGLIKHEFLKALMTRFSAEGLVIPRPLLDVTLKNTH